MSRREPPGDIKSYSIQLKVLSKKWFLWFGSKSANSDRNTGLFRSKCLSTLSCVIRRGSPFKSSFKQYSRINAIFSEAENGLCAMLMFKCLITHFDPGSLCFLRKSATASGEIFCCSRSAAVKAW